MKRFVRLFNNKIILVLQLSDKSCLFRIYTRYLAKVIISLTFHVVKNSKAMSIRLMLSKTLEHSQLSVEERKRKMIKEYSDLVDFHCQGKGLKEDKKLTMVLVNHSMKQQTRFFVLFKLNSQITTAQALASEL